MDSSIDSPLDTPKKEGNFDVDAKGSAVGVRSFDDSSVVAKNYDIGSSEVGGGVAKGSDVGFRSSATIKAPIKPWDTPGFCRKCYDRMHLIEDGRGGMWIDPTNGSVFVDGCGLCIDCELNFSVETDPNWGRSRTISGEDYSSSSEEVSSSSPSKKKQ
ncbi:hypothetical protein vseg_000174 [Gypsophila vaccaria]